MLQRIRRLVGPSAVAMAIVVLATSPVAAGHPVADLSPGALIADVSGVAIDKGGEVTVKVRYTCSPYDAPYDGSDLVIASITAGASGYDGVASVTCNGNDQQLSMSLTAFNGGVEGTANLQFAHEGLTADGSSGTIGVSVDVPVKVVITGH
jgi:hypothetical protein